MAEKIILYLALFILGRSLLPFLSQNFRKIALLLISLVFVALLGWPALTAAISFSLFNFLWGLVINGKRDLILSLGICLNIFSILLFNSSGALSQVGARTASFSAENLTLMIGLSFYSLQHIAYLVDVHKGRIPAERDLSDFFLGSLYFTKFICGPITLYQEFKSQITVLDLSTKKLCEGLNRILLGIFKKIVIADRLAPSVNSIFDYQDELPGLTIFSGAILFTVQLYFDFSAYSDLAIGSSKILGIQLKENFDLPLRASSVTVFWRRWHRSLLQFFTTYVFLPLTFRWRSMKKMAVALGIVTTFLLSGFWHGLGITFILWAICHIIFLLVEMFFIKNPEQREKRPFFTRAIFGCFTIILVSFSNIFFRSPGPQACFHLLGRVFSIDFLPDDWLVNFIAPLAVGGHQIDRFNFYVSLLLVLFYLGFEKRWIRIFSTQKINYLATYVLLLLIFLFGIFGNGQRFIYMQF